MNRKWRIDKVRGLCKRAIRRNKLFGEIERNIKLLWECLYVGPKMTLLFPWLWMTKSGSRELMKWIHIGVPRNQIENLIASFDAANIWLKFYIKLKLPVWFSLLDRCYNLKLEFSLPIPPPPKKKMSMRSRNPRW